MAFLIGLLEIELLEIGSLRIILSSINQLADTTLVFYLLLTPLSAYFSQKYNAKKCQKSWRFAGLSGVHFHIGHLKAYQQVDGRERRERERMCGNELPIAM